MREVHKGSSKFAEFLEKLGGAAGNNRSQNHGDQFDHVVMEPQAKHVESAVDRGNPVPSPLASEPATFASLDVLFLFQKDFVKQSLARVFLIGRL